MTDKNFMIHVYPTHDTAKHQLEGIECWCSPEIDEEHGLVIHNSYDQRETYEQGRKPQ